MGGLMPLWATGWPVASLPAGPMELPDFRGRNDRYGNRWQPYQMAGCL